MTKWKQTKSKVKTKQLPFPLYVHGWLDIRRKENGAERVLGVGGSVGGCTVCGDFPVYEDYLTRRKYLFRSNWERNNTATKSMARVDEQEEDVGDWNMAPLVLTGCRNKHGRALRAW